MTNIKSKPYPLGASLSNEGCNFSIYCPDTNNIRLALFDAHNRFHTYALCKDNAGIKHVFVPNVKVGQKYGYIIDHKEQTFLISDPYATGLEGPLHYTPPFDQDTGFELSKCVVSERDFDWEGSSRPNIPRESTVIFETHIKGATQLNKEITPHLRGKYLGLASEPMLKFFKENNINCLQLLPVTSCMHEPHLLVNDMVNYWGYNPYLFMVPDPRYAEKDSVYELKTMIKKLHQQGIEVILDVVYNHTAESGHGGPVFNLKALDSKYYLQRNGHHMNYTGCGNTLDLNYQPSLNLVMDSLRYWAQEFKIDGFRFDLAATLGRDGENFNRHAAFFKAIGQDPVLKEIKLIAEPWDIGPNGYQVGNFPQGWNECNDKMRDITRSFWRGDYGILKEFTKCLMGSREIYNVEYWPLNMTVNYITYHDGFTLQDLVSYNHKHNEANKENNRDGHHDNRSYNHGVEGESDDKNIIALREKQKRNFMGSLLFSFGIPHVLFADFLSHSQKGNNNAYCQDSAISWIDWDKAKQSDQFRQWLSELIEVRQKIMPNFISAFSGSKRNGNRIKWSRPDGLKVSHCDWENLYAVGLHIGVGKHGSELFYCFNQSDQNTNFALPFKLGQQWHLLCNTNDSQIMKPASGDAYMLLPGKSMAIFYLAN